MARVAGYLWRAAIIGMLAPLLTGCNREPTDVSIIALIANPRKYDGARVLCIGFLRLEFEGNALYVNEQDYRAGITKNAVWIDVPQGSNHRVRSEIFALSNHYVIVQGQFSAKRLGHMSSFSGTIGRVSRLEPWPVVVSASSRRR